MEKRLTRDARDRRKRLSAQHRDAVKRFMRDRGLEVRDWTAKAGVPPNTLYMFLRGDTEFLTIDTMDLLLAVVPGARVSELLGDEPPPPPRFERLPCQLEACANAWVEGIYPPPPDEHAFVEFPLPANVPADEVVRLTCRHAEQLYPQDSFLSVVRPERWRRAARGGDKLVMVCERDGAWEVTVREVQEGMRRNRSREGGDLVFRCSLPELRSVKVDMPWPYHGQAWRDEGGFLWQCRGRVTMQSFLETPVLATRLARDAGPPADPAAAPPPSPPLKAPRKTGPKPRKRPDARGRATARAGVAAAAE